MTDLDAQVAALTQRLSDVRKTRARADAEHDAAQASRDSVLKALARDFGVSTPDQARAKLEDLQSELAHELNALQEALNAMEGQG